MKLDLKYQIALKWILVDGHWQAAYRKIRVKQIADNEFEVPTMGIFKGTIDELKKYLVDNKEKL